MRQDLRNVDKCHLSTFEEVQKLEIAKYWLSIFSFVFFGISFVFLKWFEQGVYKSFRVGPYCFGLIACQGILAGYLPCHYKCWVKKCILFPLKFSVQKVVGSKKMLSPKNLISKKIWCSKNIFGRKKFLDQNNFALCSNRKQLELKFNIQIGSQKFKTKNIFGRTIF